MKSMSITEENSIQNTLNQDAYYKQNNKRHYLLGIRGKHILLVGNTIWIRLYVANQPPIDHIGEMMKLSHLKI